MPRSRRKRAVPGRRDRQPPPEALPPAGRLRRFWPALRGGAIAFALVLVIRLADPFGFDHAVAQQAGQLVSRLWSMTYPPAIKADGHGPAYARDGIVAITIDEAYFASEPGQRLSWPLPLERVAELLEQVLDAGPRMIFLDMILAQDRSGAAALPRPSGIGLSTGGQAVVTQLIRARATAGQPVPVVLADLPSSRIRAQCGSTTAAGARDADGRNKQAGTGPEKGAVLDPFACAAAALSPVLWEAEDGIYPARARDQRETPAFMMHGLLHGHAEGAATSRGAHHGPDALQLVWNVGPARPNPACPYASTPLPLWDRLVLLRQTVLPPDNEFQNADEHCLPIAWLSAGDLFSLPRWPEVKQALAGRVVLIGPAWDTAPDMVATPFHGRIPGVFVHAMALDNLMSYGGRYPRAETRHGDLRHMETWLSAIIVGLTIGLTRVARALWPGAIGDWRQLFLGLGLVSLFSWLASFSPEVSSAMPFVLPIMVGIVEPLMMLGGGHVPGQGHGGDHDGDHDPGQNPAGHDGARA